MTKVDKGGFTRALLMILAALLTFGGPTYLLYALSRLAVPAPLLILVGLISFLAGVILFAYLEKGRRISEPST